VKYIVCSATAIFFVCTLLVPSTTANQAAEPLFFTSDRCMACHNGLVEQSGKDISIGANWRGAMMANSSRDPYWHAAVRREIMDHPTAQGPIEDKCSSCHMPMARFMAKAVGEKGAVFEHLPDTTALTEQDILAADGVSCTMCHQISDEGLGTKESFTAGFVVDTEMPFGQRAVFGPFDVDAGRTRVMHSSSLFMPTMKQHLQDSAFCASCHTLYTHALGSNGEIVGEFPEQVPYLEWRHSAYKDSRNCQSCHMPVLQKPTGISSVLEVPREGFSQHVFRGGNFFMPKIFNRFRVELGVEALPSDLDRTMAETQAHLETKAARITIQQATVDNGRLQVGISVENLAGHKLPTAYPSRRVWLNLTVRDRQGSIVFTSGKLKQDGSIEGNDNDSDSRRYEPHYTLIEDQEQVQIYEAIMADNRGQVTTGLLSAVRYVKDNRLLPRGFEKEDAPEDIAVRGMAAEDVDFDSQGDSILYSVAVDESGRPFSVEAALRYQPVAYRWARNLSAYEAAETDRFVRYYGQMAQESDAALVKVETTVE
jgi:hypothetical protein